ncbi:hypothetical protein D8674_042734 [Pyrus ussuriensis x Pyrus communis]|uniref:Uncharacterized protein n=1 Tax=Pyrus ussuriensis x Pyrus communis TaxID=2448454 RepID=A0A5N5FEX2_9ROSA|nr:hypothetical protein D8674_032444 [Pyrus ussuriensis x Pyrus communis]KAB2604704.1 hypothetical protein D8674_042734 [Pyrus ussuriensis x Pyrus communis]
MAGLQYNFFPTDFLYPRAAPKLRTLEKATDLPLQTTKADHAASDLEQLKIQHRGVQVVKIAKSPPVMHAFFVNADTVRVVKLVKIMTMNFRIGLFMGYLFDNYVVTLLACLQYNFFPTDFFYPRTTPQSMILEPTNKAATLPLQTTKIEDVAGHIEQLKIQHRGVKVVKIAKSHPAMHG